jgi:hypothetical protein
MSGRVAPRRLLADDQRHRTRAARASAAFMLVIERILKADVLAETGS